MYPPWKHFYDQPVMTQKIKMTLLPLFAMGPPIYVTQEDMESFAYPDRIEFEEH